MDLNSILALTEADRKAVDREINRRLSSDVALINQLGGISFIAVVSVCGP